MRFANQRAKVATLVVLLALLVIELVLISRARPVAASDPGAESQFLALLNRDRSAAGLPELSSSGDLVGVARQHAVDMADAGTIFHVDFGSQVSGWLAIAENVGMSQSVEAMHESFTTSAPHRQNLMDGRYTQVGIGVEWRGPTFYVTEIFRQPREAEARPAAALPPPPPPAPSSPTTVPPTTVVAETPPTTVPPTTVVAETPPTTVPPTTVVEEHEVVAASIEHPRAAGWPLDGETLAALLLGLIAWYLVRRRHAEDKEPH